MGSGAHLDEGQVVGDELVTVVHDEHAAHVQLDVVRLLLLVEQVKRRALWHKQHSLWAATALQVSGNRHISCGRRSSFLQAHHVH